MAKNEKRPLQFAPPDPPDLDELMAQVRRICFEPVEDQGQALFGPRAKVTPELQVEIKERIARLRRELIVLQSLCLHEYSGHMCIHCGVHEPVAKIERFRFEDARG